MKPLICGILTVFISSAIFFVESARGADQLERIVIAQWGKEKILLYLPLYIAMEKGYFRELGLDVSLRYAGNDDQVFAAVISGEASFGVGDPVFAAIAQEKGFPGKVVALLVTKLGNSGFTKNDDIPAIHDPAELTRFRIATYPAPSTTYTLVRRLLENEKVGTSSQIVQSAIGAQIAALESGSADIAVDIEPAVSLAESKGYRVVLSLDAFTPPLAITGLTTSDQFISTNPKRVESVVKAIGRALKLIAEAPEEAKRVAVLQFPTLEAALVERAFDRMKDLGVYPANPIVPDTLWQQTLSIRIEVGDLAKPQEITQSVDNSFAERTTKE